jgi:hypothetical protein
VEIDEWQAKTIRRINNAKNETKKTADHDGAVVLVRHFLTAPWLAGNPAQALRRFYYAGHAAQS